MGERLLTWDRSDYDKWWRGYWRPAAAGDRPGPPRELVATSEPPAVGLPRRWALVDGDVGGTVHGLHFAMKAAGDAWRASTGAAGE